MASDDIKIRLKAFLDSSGAQKDIDSFVDKNQKKPIDVKVNVDIDENDSQQKIQSAINRLRGHNAIRFPVEIDTKGMSAAFQSFNQQIENYERKIKDAGGIIKKMDIAPHFETAVWDDGEEHIEKTYKALITYQTAVGETIQQIITLNTATGEISETTGKMSVDFEKQRKDFTQLASAVESYTAKSLTQHHVVPFRHLVLVHLQGFLEGSAHQLGVVNIHTRHKGESLWNDAVLRPMVILECRVVRTDEWQPVLLFLPSGTDVGYITAEPLLAEQLIKLLPSLGLCISPIILRLVGEMLCVQCY